VSGDVGVPDEDERDVPRPIADMELRAGVELGGNLPGSDVLGVVSGVMVYKAHACSVLIFVESGEPGGQALDGRLELGVHVDEGAKLVGQPLEADLLLAAASNQLLDAAIREVHASHSALPGGVGVRAHPGDGWVYLPRSPGRRAVWRVAGTCLPRSAGRRAGMAGGPGRVCRVRPEDVP